MKIRLNKIYEATPMSRHEAEIKTGRKIRNLTHGDSGYLIEGKWFPINAINSKSVPFDTDMDRILFLTEEIRNMSKNIPTSTTPASKGNLVKSIHKLLKLLQK